MVLDNSVVMSWCFKDESGPYSLAVLDFLGSGETIVPSVWPLEVGNTLLVAERRKRLAREDAVRFFAALEVLSVVVVEESPTRKMKEIWEIAREQQLSTYDASYLDLAIRKGLPLAIQDKSLLRAAGACGVSIFQP